MNPVLSLLFWIARRVWSWLFYRKSNRKETSYSCRMLDELPNSYADNLVYVVGEGKNLWIAAFLCPCGCGALIQLSLLENDSPHWSLSIIDNRPTISPSINRISGCCSHFFLRKGAVEWCKTLQREFNSGHS